MAKIGVDVNGKPKSAWKQTRLPKFLKNSAQYINNNASHFIALIIFILAHVALVNIF